MTALFTGPDRRATDRRALQAASKRADDKKWVERAEGDRRAAVPAFGVWQPIETAPKDRSEVLLWREDCGQFIGSYTRPEAFPLTQEEIEATDEGSLYAEDWFTQWPQAIRCDGSEAPTHWMPLPQEPQRDCTGCDGRGEVGGLRADGYHTEACPFCKGSGLEGGAA